MPVTATVVNVVARWDPEAEVWVATSDDVPGLATEASTAEELEAKLRDIVPELLELNDDRYRDSHFPIELLLHQEKRIDLGR